MTDGKPAMSAEEREAFIQRALKVPQSARFGGDTAVVRQRLLDLVEAHNGLVRNFNTLTRVVDGLKQEVKALKKKDSGRGRGRPRVGL